MKKHVFAAILICTALLGVGCSQKKETEKVTEAAAKATTEAAAPAPAAEEALSEAAGTVEEAVSEAVGIAEEAASEAVGIAEEAASEAVGTVEEAVSEAVGAAEEAVSEAAGAAESAAEEMSEAAQGALEAVSEAGADAQEAISEAAEETASEAAEAVEAVSEAASEGAESAGEAVEAAAEEMTEAVSEAIAAFGTMTEAVTEEAAEAAAEEMTEAVTEEAAEAATEALTETVTEEAVEAAAEEATEAVTEAAAEEETEAVTEAAAEEETEEAAEEATETAAEEATEEATEAVETVQEEPVSEEIEPLSEEAEEAVIEELGERPDYKATDFVKLGTYKHLPIELEKVSVSEEEVQTQIASSVEANNLYDITEEGTVKNGDIVNIDFVGKLDGEAFDGGSAQDYDLTIGSHSFITGFEEGLEGVAIGDTVDLPLSFPENYFNSDLAGKEVIFTVTVNSVKSMPELTDELAQKLSGDSEATVDSYKESVRDDLLQQKEDAEETQINSELMTQLYNTCEIKEYPEDLVKYSVQQMTNFYAGYAENYNMSFSDFVEQYFGIDMETYESEAQEAVKQSLQQEMILKAIAEQEQLEVSDEEFETGCKKYADNMGYDSVEDFKADYDEVTIRSSIQMDKAMEFVVDNAMISYVEPETETEGIISEAETEAVTE